MIINDLTTICNMYIVYKDAVDIDKKFSIRRWEITKEKIVPKEMVLKSDDYLHIYNYLEEKGYTKIDRLDQDDVAILEAWL